MMLAASIASGLAVIAIGLWAHARPARPARLTVVPGKAARGINVPGRGFVWR